MKKRVGSLLLSSAILLSSTASFAAEFDLIVKETGETHSIAKWTIDPRLQVHTGVSPEKYEFEFNDKKYEFKDIQRLMGEDKDLSLEEAAKILDGEEDELVVKSVSAITDTVNVDGDKVEFAINGEKEAADLEKLAEKGYTVKFLASAKVFKDDNSESNTSETGELKNGLTAGNKFKYQVIVSKDGKEVAKNEEYKEVLVEDKATKVVAISEVKVLVNDVEIESGKLAKDDDAKLVVMGRTADMKADDKDKSLEIDGKNLKVTTSDNKKAKVANDGKISQSGLAGDVVLTAEAGDIKKEVKLNVLNDARKISKEKSTVTPDAIELAMDNNAKETIKLVLKDQYGDAVKVEKLKDVSIKEVVVDNKQIIPAVSEADKVNEDHSVEITVKSQADNHGKGKLVITADGTEFSLDVEVKKAGEVAEYKLEVKEGKEAKLDFVKGLEKQATLQLEYNAYDKDGLVTEAEEDKEIDKFNFESSDKDVVEVDESGKVTAIGVGNATITMYGKDDALKEEVASIEITVEDATPVLASAKAVKQDKVVEADKKIKLNHIITEIKVETVAGKESELEAKIGADGAVTVEVGNQEGITIGKINAVGSNGEVFNIANGELNITKGKGKITVFLADLDGKEVESASTDIEVEIPADAE